MGSDREFGIGFSITCVAFAFYLAHLFRKGEFTYRGVRFSKTESKIPFYFLLGLLCVITLVGFCLGLLMAEI